jgi:hypothetical protein
MMSPRLCSFLVTAVALSSAARAGQVCYSSDVPPSFTNWTQRLGVPQFDPNLGVLNSVSVSFSGRLQGSLRFESLDAKPAVVSSVYAAQIVLALQGDPNSLVSLTPSQSFNDAVTAFDGAIDFGGTSGVSHLGIDVTDAGVWSPVNLAPFTGTGTVAFVASAAGSSIVTGPGNVVSQIQTVASVHLTVCYDFAPDCDHDGIPDAVEIAQGAPDRYGPGTCGPDGVPDSCQPEADCDHDGLPDRCELANNDCDHNGIPDDCQPDCDHDGVADACEILGGAPDRYGAATCVPDGVPDVCQPQPDCDNDGWPDRCAIAGGAPDVDHDGVPDNCQPDCDHDGIPDSVEIARGAPDRYGPNTCAPDGIPDSCQPDADCDHDGIPDRCDLGGNDCDHNNVPDNCQPDCDANGVADACEILNGAADRYGPSTCTPDGVPDVCQPQPDCDHDGLPDRCEVDSNGNGTPDDCEQFPDCNHNGIPDATDIANGTAHDLDHNGIPDECQGTQGCTLGYWKNHPQSWPPTGFHTTDSFNTVFNVNAFPAGTTLMQALNMGGGGLRKLARQGTAALLNAAHGGVDFELDVATVIAVVHAAIVTGQYEPLATILDNYNQDPCPLN